MSFVGAYSNSGQMVWFID